MIGNAVNATHFGEILSRWHPVKVVVPITLPTVCDINPSALTAEQLEEKLSKLSLTELTAWVQSRLEGYTLPQLDLEVKEGT